MVEISASLVVLFKKRKNGEWVEVFHYPLTELTVRIGRLQEENDLVIDFVKSGGKSYVSRKHATLFKYRNTKDYEIMDGSRTEATIENPKSVIIPSACGVSVNGRRLEYGIKCLLKHNDRITLVPDKLDLIYLRPPNKVIDKMEDSDHETYIPISGESTDGATYNTPE